MQRGEVWWCNLDPTIGAEQQKKRSCVIVNEDAVDALVDLIKEYGMWKDIEPEQAEEVEMVAAA